MSKYVVNLTKTVTVPFVFEAENAAEAIRLAKEVDRDTLYFDDYEPPFEFVEYEFGMSDAYLITEDE